MIKRRPEDFLVEEVLAPETAARISGDTGAFAILRLTKRNLGTDEALEMIARRLRIPLERIGYAGLKDKYALTVQHVSIDERETGPGAAPAFVEEPGWKLELAGRIDERLSAESIAGNRFRIAARSLTRRECEGLTAGRRLLSLPGARGRALRFVNYYGPQRFGSARHGRGFAARRLIDGDFEGALKLLISVADRKDSRVQKAAKRAIGAAWGDWARLSRTLPPCHERIVVERLLRTGGNYREAFSALPYFIRQITIEAYQSRLWNEVARRVISRRCPPPLIEAPARFGGLVFPGPAGVPEEIASVSIPLFCPRTTLREPWMAEAESVLAADGVTLKDLRVSGVRVPYFGEVSRPLFVDALEFSLGPVEADELSKGGGAFMRRMKFFLPRGAYATVLLAALGAAPQSSFR